MIKRPHRPMGSESTVGPHEQALLGMLLSVSVIRLAVFSVPVLEVEVFLAVKVSHAIGTGVKPVDVALFEVRLLDRGRPMRVRIAVHRIVSPEPMRRSCLVDHLLQGSISLGRGRHREAGSVVMAEKIRAVGSRP